VKRVAWIVVLPALLAACGEAGLLDGLGDRSRQVVYGSTTTVTTVIDDDVDIGTVRGKRAVDLVWYNDTIPDQLVGDPPYTIAQVWNRGKAAGRIIQASRLEIAAGLPEVAFPRLVPRQVGWVTSQLLYDAASATLDGGTSAQFGMWQIEPYTVDEGRVAILYVGSAPDGVDDTDITSEAVEQGTSLSWYAGAYRYELFCRASLAEEQCWQMAETMVGLDTLLPD
jgi:hypothetical protein